MSHSGNTESTSPDHSLFATVLDPIGKVISVLWESNQLASSSMLTRLFRSISASIPVLSRKGSRTRLKRLLSQNHCLTVDQRPLHLINDHLVITSSLPTRLFRYHHASVIASSGETVDERVARVFEEQDKRASRSACLTEHPRTRKRHDNNNLDFLACKSIAFEKAVCCFTPTSWLSSLDFIKLKSQNGRNHPRNEARNGPQTGCDRDAPFVLYTSVARTARSAFVSRMRHQVRCRRRSAQHLLFQTFPLSVLP